ncbi:MAG: hypothetical protein LBT93_03480, partial [Treponema sp.]|nr:hypothetical protein [Treponema sp.]
MKTKLFLPVVFLVLVFFACDSRKSSSGTASSSAGAAPSVLDPAKPVTISFWHSMTDEAGTEFESYIQEFNSTLGAEKGIIVESVFQGQYSDATAKLRPLLQNKQGDRLPD